MAFSEMLINVLYNRAVYPLLADKLEINIFMTKVSAEAAIAAFGKGIIWVLTQGIAEGLPAVIGTRISDSINLWAGTNIVEQLMSQTAQMTDLERKIYFAVVAGICVLLLLVLLLPYILAAIGFSTMVIRKMAELEQEELHQNEEADKRRNLLLSNVAHDLKTPMTTVMGYASALAEGQIKDSEKQQEYLNAICNKSMHMSGLISLLFEYVKLDSEGFSLKRTREDITELLRESVAALYTDFEEKQMDVETEIPEEPIYISIDKVQFQRAASNLLSNTIKHNIEGTRVGVIMQKEDDMLKIQICDSGIEIPKEIADYIFDPFVMGDESRSSKGGSGLGLSIVQKIISMHDGEISLCQELHTQFQKAFIIKLKMEEEM